ADDGTHQGGTHQGGGGRRAMARPISVLIVDDHPVVRRGLRVLLEVQDGIEVAGEAGDAATALALAVEHAPDVILLDLQLPAAEAAGTLMRIGGSPAAALDALTPREREVLAQLARGRSNREIARVLQVSEKTVKAHVSSVLAKLGVSDRTQAALLAVRHERAI